MDAEYFMVIFSIFPIILGETQLGWCENSFMTFCEPREPNESLCRQRRCLDQLPIYSSIRKLRKWTSEIFTWSLVNGLNKTGNPTKRQRPKFWFRHNYNEFGNELVHHLRQHINAQLCWVSLTTWGASFRWSSYRCFPMRNSDQMTIGKRHGTHPTLEIE